jgi:hypothetical protein
MRRDATHRMHSPPDVDYEYWSLRDLMMMLKKEESARVNNELPRDKLRLKPDWRHMPILKNQVKLKSGKIVFEEMVYFC